MLLLLAYYLFSCCNTWIFTSTTKKTGSYRARPALLHPVFPPARFARLDPDTRVARPPIRRAAHTCLPGWYLDARTVHTTPPPPDHLHVRHLPQHLHARHLLARPDPVPPPLARVTARHAGATCSCNPLPSHDRALAQVATSHLERHVVADEQVAAPFRPGTTPRCTPPPARNDTLVTTCLPFVGDRVQVVDVNPSCCWDLTWQIQNLQPGKASLHCYFT